MTKLGIISGPHTTPTYVNTELAKKANSLDVYLKTETYNKTEINDKFTDIIGGAPAVLDTLKELSDALGADANFSATITTSLSGKAPINNPTFTGSVGGDYQNNGWIKRG